MLQGAMADMFICISFFWVVSMHIDLPALGGGAGGGDGAGDGDKVRCYFAVEKKS
jgi:hypothetical protein